VARSGAPYAAAAQNTASLRFSSDLPEVPAVAALNMAVIADVEEIGQGGVAARVVSLDFVAGGAATLAAGALGN